jgi:hypothetical protein
LGVEWGRIARQFVSYRDIPRVRDSIPVISTLYGQRW